MKIAIGVDLGGTKLSAAVVDLDSGSLLRRHQVLSPAARGAEAMLDATAKLVLRVGVSDDVAIGIAAAGLIDPDSGLVVSSTDTIDGWAGTRIVEGLRDRLAATATHITLLNDVDAHALGESEYGAGRDADSMLMIAVGTGVGGALVRAGRIVRGAHHAAGEIGHIPVHHASGMRCPCGRVGHLEGIAAGPAIARLYRSIGGTKSAVDGHAVAVAAEQGDPHAITALGLAGGALGSAIAGIVTTVDPAVVVVGGGVAGAGDAWWNAVVRAARRELVDVLSGIPILRAERPDDAAIVGAALAAGRDLAAAS